MGEPEDVEEGRVLGLVRVEPGAAEGRSQHRRVDGDDGPEAGDRVGGERHLLGPGGAARSKTSKLIGPDTTHPSAIIAAVRIDAVTFDFWNTLMYEEAGHLKGRRLAAWIGILEDAGFAIERQRLDAAFDVSWNAYVAAWTANRQYHAAEAAEKALEELGFEPPPGVREELLAAFREAGNEADLTPAPNIAGCLAELTGAGVRVGIVCDVGMTPGSVLRSHLERVGLLGHFSHWSFSDEVGIYKPAAGIFRHALAGLGGVAPGRAAHVGDLRRTDIAGAQGIGMTAVRYTGVFDDDSAATPEGDHVVADHAALPAILGL